MEQYSLEEVRTWLQEAADESYREFNRRLLPGVPDVLGVRMPQLRKLAGKIVRWDVQKLLAQMEQAWRQGNLCHEERLLWAMILGKSLKKDWQEAEQRIREFVPVINNWAVCDCFCGDLKIAGKFPEAMWELLGSWQRSKEEYESRFAMVMMLNHFVREEWAAPAFEVLDHFQGEGYYAKMGAAWALAEYYVRLPQLTAPYLLRSRLDDWTYNQGLQKICQSLRPDRKSKEWIRSLKRKKTAVKVPES